MNHATEVSKNHANVETPKWRDMLGKCVLLDTTRLEI